MNAFDKARNWPCFFAGTGDVGGLKSLLLRPLSLPVTDLVAIWCVGLMGGATSWACAPPLPFVLVSPSAWGLALVFSVRSHPSWPSLRSGPVTLFSRLPSPSPPETRVESLKREINGYLYGQCHQKWLLENNLFFSGRQIEIQYGRHLRPIWHKSILRS